MLTEPADIEAEFRKHPKMMCARGTRGTATAAEADHPAAGRGPATTANPATATIDETPASSGYTTSRALEMTAAMVAT
jgi:hypothetical protein